MLCFLLGYLDSGWQVDEVPGIDSHSLNAVMCSPNAAGHQLGVLVLSRINLNSSFNYCVEHFECELSRLTFGLNYQRRLKPMI